MRGPLGEPVGTSGRKNRSPRSERQRASRRATSSINGSLTFSVDECWLGGWRGPSVFEAGADGIRLVTDAGVRPTAHLPGTVLPGFVDAHVHLGLVDATALSAGGIAAVDDLGWVPDVARTWPGSPGWPEVRFAGAFLTAPGGYPTGRRWAPAASVEEITSPSQAPAAIDRQLAAGASFIKVTLNSDVGPVLDDATLHALVGHAHARGTTVTAHAQGSGQAARAFDAGVDRLAHAPWTERLDDALLKAMTPAQSWVSTLDIHGWGDYGEDFAVAADNVRRFHALGGTVVYGTDLGNGPLPLGINERELRAFAAVGIDGDDVVRALVAPEFGAGLSYLPGERPTDTAGWLATASVIRTAELRERFA